MSKNRNYKLFVTGFEVKEEGSCLICLSKGKGFTFAEILPKLEKSFVKGNFPFELTFVLPDETEKSFIFNSDEEVDFVSAAHKVAAAYLAEKFGAKKEKLKFKSGGEQKNKEFLDEVKKKIFGEAIEKEVKTYEELVKVANEVGKESFATFLLELTKQIAEDESDELPDVVTYVYTNENNEKIKAKIPMGLLLPFVVAGVAFLFSLDDELDD